MKFTILSLLIALVAGFVNAQTRPDLEALEKIQKHNKHVTIDEKLDTIPVKIIGRKIIMPSDILKEGVDSQYVIRPVAWKFKPTLYLPALGGALVSGFTGAMDDKERWDEKTAMSLQTVGLTWTVALNPGKSSNKPGWIKWIAEPLAYFTARQLAYYGTYNIVK